MQLTMVAFLKELEPVFKALPVKRFHPQVLKEEFEASVETPELKKLLLAEEVHARHLLLSCIVITSSVAFFLKLFKASKQPSAMEVAGASLLEGLSPYLGFLTKEAILRFFKARVELRRSVFKKPLDQLSVNLIKSNQFSTSLFDPQTVEKVTEAFSTFRDRTVS